MPEYNDRTQTFISKDDFFQMNRMDIIYTGYVEGLGYAFEEQIYIDESLYRQNGDNFFIQSLYKELIILQNHI